MAAAYTIRRLRGSREAKRNSLCWWVSMINQDLGNRDLHRVIHQPFRGLATLINEIKQTFGYSQEKYEQYLRNRVMNFEGIRDSEAASQAWQRFKLSYRETNRHHLVSAGDRKALLEKVRMFCEQCKPLQDRVGLLMRKEVKSSCGNIFEKEEAITFERMARVMDAGIQELEEERGIQLRRTEPYHRNEMNSRNNYERTFRRPKSDMYSGNNYHREHVREYPGRTEGGHRRQYEDKDPHRIFKSRRVEVCKGQEF